MLRRLLLAVLIPPLLLGVTLLVVIGLKDFNLLVDIVSRLIVVTVIIGIPVIIVRMIVFPGRSRNERR